MMKNADLSDLAPFSRAGSHPGSFEHTRARSRALAKITEKRWRDADQSTERTLCASIAV
jgi:hypothetical protein